ncbi:MAG: NYN domain-containing protein [Lachnospiraceae bacterium]|nr:NYN domain-containing protein [Lachnospiraceae bacterium]
MTDKRRLCAGIVAHVDAGKTTLSESMLYLSGTIRQAGRVDHGDAFLDTDTQERERGITIFSKQAVLSLEGAELTLVDTPGHVDFSAEMERTLSILDFAVLVISAPEGIQSHTETLWRLLNHYHVPVFVFVNKIDIYDKSSDAIMTVLRKSFSENCICFSEGVEWAEAAAMCTENALEEYSETGTLSPESVRALVRDRFCFPCYFGSALKSEGVQDLLDGIADYAPETAAREEFGARVFKISSDDKGQRLTHIRLFGGSLAPRQQIGSEKIAEIRLYSGEKYQPLSVAEAGQVVTLTGLNETRPGQGLGFIQDSPPPLVTPVIAYSLELPTGQSDSEAYRKLSTLGDELPELSITWDEENRKIRIRSMGEVQNEILQRIVKDRFGYVVNFGQGRIQYHETIRNPVTGYGHFEPLRHYAEVHLRLEPGERGSGLTFETECSTDILALNWQRLILTHLKERVHRGVLTGSPIDDLKLVVTGGRAHLKHTEGGDFRQATYRAVRQGLMKAESVLLEPFYSFVLMVPSSEIGRAMTELSERGCSFDAPEQSETTAVLRGRGPVRCLSEYPKELRAYTAGRGQLSFAFDGYDECRDADRIIEELGYDCEEDLRNPSGSVFCAHGAGFLVPWDEVENYIQAEDREADAYPADLSVYVPKAAKATTYSGTYAEDKELEAIFEREFGPVKRTLSDDYWRKAEEAREKKSATGKTTADYKAKAEKKQEKKEYLLVDGYNIIHAWPELKSLSESDLTAARDSLTETLCNYQGYTGVELMLVFDAYKRPNNPGSVQKYNNIYIIYTKENETADMYIERITRDLAKKHHVRVATSDALEQTLILGGGATRLSARELEEEILKVCGRI